MSASLVDPPKLADALRALPEVVAAKRPPRAVWIALCGVLVLLFTRRYAVESPTADRLEALLGHCGLMAAAGVLCTLRAVRVEYERGAWAFIAGAMVANAIGETTAYALYPDGAGPVGAPDVFWLAYYPLITIGIVLLVKERFRHIEATRLLDGLQAAMLVSSIGLAVVFFPILDRHSSARHTGDIIDIVYPICDLIVIGALLGAFALSGFRLGRSWWFVAAGLMLFVVVDTLYALEVLTDSTTASGLLDAGWPAASLMIAYAAWLPEHPVRAVASDDWRTAVLPELVCVIAIATQVADYLGLLGDTPRPALLFLVAAQVLFFFQLAGAPRTARAARGEDPFSGIGNRRALVRDLERACSRDASPRVLALCTIGGLDDLTRRDGRAVRDEALDAAAAVLEERFGHWASPYRGEAGDFWVLAPRQFVPLPELLAAELVVTLDQHPQIHTAVVALPLEAGDAAEAMRLAEERLHADAFR